MSGRLVKEVLENAPDDLTPLELLVLVSIAESSRDGDRSTRGSAGSAEAIAFRVRSSAGSVRNVLSRLSARALIKPLHERTARGRAQQYRLSELHEWHRETRHRIEP
jgi:DNA-binding MarR family transcriptional regulator